MHQQSSDEAQVSYRDVSTYFSNEEWRLLHDWQKDLYRNVMKEIHQALTALGPLITTTLFTLREKEKQELYKLDTQDSKKGHHTCKSPGGDTVRSPDLSVRENGEQPLHRRYSKDTRRRGSDNSQSTGSPNVKNEKSLRTEDPGVIVIDQVGPEVGGSRANANLAYPVVTAVFSLSGNEDKRTHFKQPVERTKDNPAVNSVFSQRHSKVDKPRLKEEALGIATEIVSVLIKEEEEPYSMDHEDNEKIENISIQTGNEDMNRAKKARESAKCSEKSTPCNTFLSKTNAKVTPNLHMETNAKRQDRLLGGEKPTHGESAFSNPAHTGLFQGSPNIRRPDKYSEFQSSQRHSQFPNYLPNTQQSQTIYTVSECDESFSPAGELGEHARTQSRERTYACNECEKRFFEKSHLIAHHRTHSGEKTYPCTFCHKTFNRKYNLDGHVRIHTGERPYKCTECEKDFSRKSDFNRHQKKHSGS
ncbi:zinc finger protein 514-like isoform X2 [Ambystoma mexicanum]|uniref:zinc finger protein 514-like isoform X2 n=1 Tax=Ambystoma mexicanum TaxID=8296 RepID=UPI0037E82FEB